MALVVIIGGRAAGRRAERAKGAPDLGPLQHQPYPV
jgi:hypothetical protein